MRNLGLDARTAREQGLSGAQDERLGTICREEGRALLTLDLGFADVRAHPPASYRGLIVLRLGTQARHHVLARVEALVPRFLHEDLDRQLWIVDETSVRIRA